MRSRPVLEVLRLGDEPRNLDVPDSRGAEILQLVVDPIVLAFQGLTGEDVHTMGYRTGKKTWTYVPKALVGVDGSTTFTYTNDSDAEAKYHYEGMQVQSPLEDISVDIDSTSRKILSVTRKYCVLVQGGSVATVKQHVYVGEGIVGGAPAVVLNGFHESGRTGVRVLTRKEQNDLYQQGKIVFEQGVQALDLENRMGVEVPVRMFDV